MAPARGPRGPPRAPGRPGRAPAAPPARPAGPAGRRGRPLGAAVLRGPGAPGAPGPAGAAGAAGGGGAGRGGGGGAAGARAGAGGGGRAERPEGAAGAGGAGGGAPAAAPVAPGRQGAGRGGGPRMGAGPGPGPGRGRRRERGGRAGVPPTKSQIALNRALTRAREPEEVLRLLANGAEVANAVNLSTACVQLAKSAAQQGAPVNRSDRELFAPHLQRLEASAVRLLDGADPRGVANLLWGFAKLGYAPEHLLAHLDQGVVVGGGGGPGVLWKSPGPRPLEAWEPQGLAMAAYALGLLGGRPPSQFLAALETEASAQLPQFAPQSTALTAWAFCKLGDAPGASRLLARVGEVFPEGFEGWPPQALGSLAFGMGSLGGLGGPAPLLAAVDAELARTLGSLAGRDDATALANALWGFGRCGFRPAALLGAAEALGVGEAPPGGPGLEALLEHLTPSNVSYAALGLAHLGESLSSSALARAVCRRAERVAGDLGPESLVPALWALAALGAHLNPAEGRFSARERALAAWWNSAARSDPADLSPKDLRMLSEVKTLLTAEASDAVFQEMQPERGDLANAIEGEVRAGGGGGGGGSGGAGGDGGGGGGDGGVNPLQGDLEEAVGRALGPGGEDYLEGAAVLSDRPSGVPTALRAPGDVNVALFIDGPEFYSRGPDGGALGRLGLRDRLLHARGYESVVSVPWHEWEALPGRAGQDAFVRDLLVNLLQAQSR